MSDTLDDPVAITSTALLIDLLTLSYRIQTRYLHRVPHVSLPPLQLLLLFIADGRPDKTIRPSKVAHALGLSMSTVSEAIRKLRHKRFLMRTDTVTDGRHKGYQLTLNGHEPLRISRSNGHDSRATFLVHRLYHFRNSSPRSRSGYNSITRDAYRIRGRFSSATSLLK